jgi:hypothetical protein
MVTSDTGHPGARLLARAHQAPGAPPCGGDKKISKDCFGFKRVPKFFLAQVRLPQGGDSGRSVSLLRKVKAREDMYRTLQMRLSASWRIRAISRLLGA